MTVILRRAASQALTSLETETVRRLLWAAFDDPAEGMTEDDWNHALGGVHVLLELDSEIVGHASVVQRELQVDGRPLRTGYVEAVAIEAGLQRRGLGSILMREIGSIIGEQFELGALGTGTPEFYEQLGWLRWLGPTFGRADAGLQRTAEDDGGILVLRTRTTPPNLDRTAPISCDWRAGDVW